MKQGADVINEDGKLVKNNTVTKPPKPSKSYAFCSDTRFDERLVKIIQGVTALYHESTFLEQHAHLANPTGHSTAKQAAEIAKLAKLVN